MGKLTFIDPIESIQGTLSKSHSSFAIRYCNGKPFSYTYERHAPWSENQHSMRSLFGATTYFAYLILRLEGATTFFEGLRKRYRYGRISAMVTALLKSLLQQDEPLCQQVMQAYAEYKALGGTASVAQKEALKATHRPLAEAVYLRLQAVL